MLQLAAFSFILSVIHLLLHPHWLPMALISRSEGWNRQLTLRMAIIVSFAHVLSTIILGIFIGIIGMEAAREMGTFTEWFAPLLLILFGIIYFSLGQHRHGDEQVKIKSHSFRRIVVSLSITLFFSPCLEMETYYFTAGTKGWNGILLISAIYLLVTVTGISILTVSGKRTIDRLNLHSLEHYEKKITGVILIAFGILSYFVKF